MTNYELLVVAVMCLAAAFWCVATRTRAAAAPLVLACILFSQGIGGQVWEWAKWSSAAGLPPTVSAVAFSDSKAVPAFLWAAIGASLSALLIPRAPETAKLASDWVPPRGLSVALIVTSVLTFCGFLIGEGPSFFRREEYLGSDGPTFVLRMFWPLGVLFGLVAVALLMVEKDRRLRLGLILAGTLWYLGPVSVGSRIALAIPLVGVFVIGYQQVTERRVRLGAICAAVGLSALAIFTFSVILQSRGMPHGLFNLPNVVEATAAKAQSSTDSFLLPVKQLASSIFTSVPNAEQSAVYGVDPHVLIANANVLPGTAQPMELERYWPYAWVPLSFAGTWYGAFGWFAQAALFGAVGWLCGYAAANILRSAYPVLSLVSVGFAGIIGALSIQYSSRQVWRVISILFVLALVSFLVRHARPRRPGDGEAEPEPADMPEVGSRLRFCPAAPSGTVA